MKRILSFIFVLGLTVGSLPAQNTVNSDFWAATDGLGRSLNRYDGQKNDKFVILFYWTWNMHKDPSGSEVKNTSEIIRRYPEAMKDGNHFAWNDKSPGNYFFWEQPLLGYYKATDKWVLRKHAEMLADAKVDAVMFDCTNGAETWDASTDSLLEVWNKAQKDGVNVPKIGFMLPFSYNNNSLASLRHLYNKYYRKGLYKNLWFYWNGKPCIMAYPDNLTSSVQDCAIRSFFTFRPGQPDYVNGPDKKRNDQWGWLEDYPQHGYVKLPEGGYELVTVGVSQNACPETQGHCSAFNKPESQSRSFSRNNGFDPRQEGYLYGWNFDEQWGRAYELNPKAVFVTGWNEWIAGKWAKKDGWTGEPFSFVDEFDWDHSRDIEPVKAWGDCGDVYYMQLIDHIRKFKGTETQPVVSAPKTIKLGKWNDWNNVFPFYATYKGNTMHRNSQACGQYHYVNNSGRNDITGARMARDNQYLYFYVETAEPLTASTGHNWMMLLLDTDHNKQTGWQGYDYIINYHNPKGDKVFIQKSFQNKWLWKDAGEGKLKMKGKQLMLRIPRNVLGLQGRKLDLEFKWSDNMQDEGNIMDFYVNGDAAPGARFNYVYRE